jgi:hypothetical protein
MRVVLDFRASASVVSNSVHVLQTSHVVEAAFQAAVALRLACLRDWHKIQESEKSELRQWTLQYLIQHSEAGHVGPTAAIISTLRAAHAITLKRQWLDSSLGPWRDVVKVRCCSHSSRDLVLEVPPQLVCRPAQRTQRPRHAGPVQPRGTED